MNGRGHLTLLFQLECGTQLGTEANGAANGAATPRAPGQPVPNHSSTRSGRPPALLTSGKLPSEELDEVCSSQPAEQTCICGRCVNSSTQLIAACAQVFRRESGQQTHNMESDGRTNNVDFDNQ
jgi:hypothetical protein